MDDKRALLRHTIATLAYRVAKAVKDAPPEFASYRASESSRTPVQILAHMGDLMAWSRRLADGTRKWESSTPLDWTAEVERFFALASELESYLAGDAPLHDSAEKLFQAPIADALQHTGQLTFLRRASGAPIRGESYHKAEIVAGRVGREQAKPKLEFD
ncbi:MAG TPA: hypothetical protein VLU46_02015 [Thermoanaerobaculia bacterium]|nr:hypothetical protein [Thermoanaerobaculia bacterium]